MLPVEGRHEQGRREERCSPRMACRKDGTKDSAQSKDGMSKDGAKNAQSKDGMSKDGGTAAKDSKSSTTTGNAATSATAAPPAEKRTQIVSAIRSEKSITETTNVNFNISVGTRVPSTVRFHRATAADCRDLSGMAWLPGHSGQRPLRHRSAPDPRDRLYHRGLSSFPDFWKASAVSSAGAFLRKAASGSLPRVMQMPQPLNNNTRTRDHRLYLPGFVSSEYLPPKIFHPSSSLERAAGQAATFRCAPASRSGNRPRETGHRFFAPRF